MRIRPTFVAALVMAAASTGALAQNVSLYGLVDLSVGRTQAPGGVGVKGVESGKMSTSYWGVKGTEDLGGGLKAQFAIESFMRNDTASAGRFDGDAFWARNAYVGLDSSVGSVTLGRNTTSLFVQTLIFNAFGDSFGFSPSIRHYFTSGTVTGDTGWSDSIRWALPRLGDISTTVHVALGEGNGGRNTGFSALYFGGPVGAGFAWQKVKKGATVADTTSWQLAGSYDLSAVKLYAQYGKVDNDTTKFEYKLTDFGLTAPVGADGTFRAQYGLLKPQSGAKRTTLTLGYTHNLSKRTELYGAWMSDKLSNTSTGSNYSVGVRHKF